MKLYITRHGETEWNLAGRLQGWENSSLTEKGIMRAHLLKDALRDIKFDRIYSSDQKRALDTAKILNGPKDREIIALKELRELGMGDWEGRLISEIMVEDGALYDNYINTPLSYKPIRGESIYDLFIRVRLALKKIEERGGNHILVVSHGITIRALILILKNLEIEYFTKTTVYPGSSLSIFEKEQEEWICIVECDTSHYGNL